MKKILLFLFLLSKVIFADCADLGIDRFNYATDSTIILAWPSIISEGLDSSAVLLMHFDSGADGSTVFVNSGLGLTNPHTVLGNAQMDTARPYFGAGSLLLDGTGDGIRFDTSGDFSMGTGAFTYDARVLGINFGTGERAIFETRIDEGTSGLLLAVKNRFLVTMQQGIKIQGTTTLNDSTWYHVALVGNGGGIGARNIKMYLNGVQEGVTWTNNYSLSNNRMRIGVGYDDVNSHFYGQIDEARASQSIERWLDTFIPPLSAYSTTMSGITISTDTVYVTEGTNSMKLVIDTTTLNEYIIKTPTTYHNLSEVRNVQIDIRASRTGSNLKLGIHDTGGTTTEITPDILNANQFQTVYWDISQVLDENKDDIDNLIITIINIDNSNTVYLDNYKIFQSNADIIGVVE